MRTKFEDREVLPAKWGLVNSWAKDARRAAQQINARAETLASAPAFKEAFRARRCVIPADGFFEWAGSKEAPRPFRFHRPDGGLLLFAGLHESWQPRPGEWQRTFTIIMTTPNSVLASIHDRMPVIRGAEAADEWLKGRPNSNHQRHKTSGPHRHAGVHRWLVCPMPVDPEIAAYQPRCIKGAKAVSFPRSPKVKFFTPGGWSWQG